MKKEYLSFTVAIIFIWVGFVCAISFMEAWLKFRATGVTIELGLAIGQLVFKALNKVEIVCALLIIASLRFSKSHDTHRSFRIYFLMILIILSIQTFWLLPVLDHRADLQITGAKLPKSSIHLWYVILEIMKVISLFIYGRKLLNRITKPEHKIRTI